MRANPHESDRTMDNTAAGIAAGPDEIGQGTPEPVLVQVGDLVATGYGDQTRVVLIAWTNRSYIPGALDAAGTAFEAPSTKATPVDAICLLAPIGDGQFAGTAMAGDFMTYIGSLTFSDEQIDAACAADDDFAAREGHTWRIEVSGYRHLEHPWWQTFREQPAPLLPTQDRPATPPQSPT